MELEAPGLLLAALAAGGELQLWSRVPRCNERKDGLFTRLGLYSTKFGAEVCVIRARNRDPPSRCLSSLNLPPVCLSLSLSLCLCIVIR